MHKTAASLLAAEDHGPDRVGLHLLDAEPAGERWVVDVLREAATGASARGAPEQAVGYLRRALREPPAADKRALVLQQLGAAELLARDPAATDHLARALDATDAPGARGAIGLLLGRAAVGTGRLATRGNCSARSSSSWEQASRELSRGLRRTGRREGCGIPGSLTSWSASCRGCARWPSVAGPPGARCG
jgi:hypothetical protein